MKITIKIKFGSRFQKQMAERYIPDVMNMLTNYVSGLHKNNAVKWEIGKGTPTPVSENQLEIYDAMEGLK